MKKILLSFSILISIVFFVKANPVSVQTASVVAKNIYLQRVQDFQTIDPSLIITELIFTKKENSKNLYYVFNIKGENNGFVIISADDDVFPVLGYSLKNKYSFENYPVQFTDLMNNYASQILYVINNNLKANDNISSEWEKYTSTSISQRRGYRSVSPLLNTTWNQGKYYNASCPLDASGPGGRVYAGCVATSMAQLMKYHASPSQGSGSKSYYHTTYGTLSANFGMSTYNWSSMPNSISTYDSDIANLLYDCGVSVEMMYGPSGSGAYTSDAATSLKTYFNYASTTQYKKKSNYTTSSWEALLKTELDNNRPMMYKGSGSAGGHAFVLDGYQGSSNNHFHFNWGWSGYYNGYFYLTSLNPGTHSFTSYQGAVIGIKPTTPSSNYDLELYDDISISPNPIVKNSSVDVWVDVANYGNDSFVGDFLVALFDAQGQYVMDIEEKTGFAMPSNSHYASGITFSKSSVTTSSGSYMIAVFSKASGSSSWILIDEESYSNPVNVTVTSATSPSDMALYDSIQVSPNPIVPRQSVDVYVNVANFDQNNAFSGSFAAVLHKQSGEVEEVIEIMDDMTLSAYSYYSNGLTFEADSLTAAPGEYLISIQYKPDGGSWKIIDEDIYTNPISITIASAPLSPDKYESNNVEGNSYNFSVNFSGNTANIKTTESNLHLLTDIDYYKINLAAGAKYTISSKVHDSRKSGNSNTYTCDVIYSYKVDNWSTTFNDDEASDFVLNDGGTVYFKVEPYYSDKGTYLLDISISRSSMKPDAYVLNTNVSPLIIGRGEIADAYCTLKNQGNSSLGSTVLKYYLSDNNILDAGDIELAASNVGAINPGSSSNLNKSFIIPATTTIGSWYILFIGDANNEIDESNENNNLAYQSISVKIPDAIEENNFISFDIFPNPNNGQFTVKINSNEINDAVINVLDIQGKVIYSKEIHSFKNGNINIDLGTISAGIYNFQLKSAKRTINRKILIK